MIRARVSVPIAVGLLALLAGPSRADDFAVLHAFDGSDGASPDTKLSADRDGNLYGTTLQGGDADCDCGMAFKLAPDGTLTVLHAFTGADGAYPDSNLVADRAGNLYGTTSAGGTGCQGFGCGTIFEITRAGELKTLYAFLGNENGFTPEGEISRDDDGNLYGVTVGNDIGAGEMIFELTTDGVLHMLYRFKDAAGGREPYGGVVRDAAGNLYGTTYHGGDTFCYKGCGTVFKYGADGSYALLHTFHSYPADDGANPQASVTLDRNGRIYGTTRYGGAGGCRCGTVFRIAASGNYKVLYAFAGLNGSQQPTVGVTLRHHAIYGGAGVNAFALDMDGGNYRVLRHFEHDDGSGPAGTLLARGAYLYGASKYGGVGDSGTVFRLAE